jgi:hypothetical protein
MPQVQQFQVNKWIRIALSLGMAAIAWAEGFDWTTVLGTKPALIVVGAIALIKAAYNAFAPSTGVDTTATNGWIITQKAVTRTPAVTP